MNIDLRREALKHAMPWLATAVLLIIWEIACIVFEVPEIGLTRNRLRATLFAKLALVERAPEITDGSHRLGKMAMLLERHIPDLTLPTARRAAIRDRFGDGLHSRLQTHEVRSTKHSLKVLRSGLVYGEEGKVELALFHRSELRARSQVRGEHARCGDCVELHVLVALERLDHRNHAVRDPRCFRIPSEHSRNRHRQRRREILSFDRERAEEILELRVHALFDFRRWRVGERGPTKSARALLGSGRRTTSAAQSGFGHARILPNHSSTSRFRRPSASSHCVEICWR